MTELTHAHPEDPYGIAKLAIEQELQTCKRMFDLDYIIFRPHNVYGERQNIGDKYRNVVGIFMNQILQDKPMSIFGDGSQTRAFSYISDVAPLIARSIEIPAARNEIFNIGSGHPYTINELALTVAEAMGVAPDIRHLEARNEVWNAYSSHAKLHRIFGDHKTVSLREGIGRMAAWVKTHGARQSINFDNIEVLKNLPPSWAVRPAAFAAAPVVASH
jgi:UDP-glucose 4-epimerase